MKHRIRVAAIIEHKNKILLVKHVHPENKSKWWVPPGGGVEDTDKSIIDSLSREVFEETTLKVEINENPKFIREFYDDEQDILNLELFFNAKYLGGKVSIDNIKGNGPDEEYIKEVKWFAVEELQDIVLFPTELKDNFGKNLKKIYLRRQ